jgi:predicted  nucleic acid-binding Zn-ribbon protein
VKVKAAATNVCLILYISYALRIINISKDSYGGQTSEDERATQERLSSKIRQRKLKRRALREATDESQTLVVASDIQTAQRTIADLRADIELLDDEIEQLNDDLIALRYD